MAVAGTPDAPAGADLLERWPVEQAGNTALARHLWATACGRLAVRR
jgi:hypothetical protein